MRPNRWSMLGIVVPSFAVLVGLAPSVGAQVVVVDEGTFTISVAGVRVGREDFSIRRSTAEDGGFFAQGTVLRGESRTVVALGTDSVGTPLRFQSERFVNGRSVENVSGEFRRGLWSGRAVGAAGESAREFRLPEPVIGADEGVVHQTWFLTRFGPRPGTRLLLPHTLTVRDLVVEDAGADSVSIGLDVVPVRKWVLRATPGGRVLREAWSDARGRILRVRIPADDLDAVRDEVPPETVPGREAYSGTEPSSQDFGTDAFVVACDPSSLLGDAGGGSDPSDADADRGARDREEEQSDLPPVDQR